MTETGVPTPNLRIVPVSSLHPHEEHDSQRSQPLIERFASETCMINPPLVAPMNSGDDYVILDGANRVFVFSELHYPHILVQVAPYDGGHVTLSNWQHIVAEWNESALLDHMQRIPDIKLEYGDRPDAIAHIYLGDSRVRAICAAADNLAERNAVLREVVRGYQQNARLHRTALTDPEAIWPLYPEAVALFVFAPYAPADIVQAAQTHAYLPPGISRHIVQGRALRVNYPLAELRDPITPLERKNAHLLEWLQNKLANRQVRYYAEATYQFDE